MVSDVTALRAANPTITNVPHSTLRYIQGSGFGVSGFRVQGSGFGVSGFRV